MLHKDRGLHSVSMFVVGYKAGDAENIQDVAVLSGNRVHFNLEAVLDADLLEGPLGVRIAVRV